MGDVRCAVDEIVHRAADGSVVASCAYRYDADGRVTRCLREDGDTILYGYDGLGRLNAEARRNSDGSIQYRYRYNYDLGGNRTWREYSKDGDDTLDVEGEFAEVYTYGYQSDPSTKAPNMLRTVAGTYRTASSQVSRTTTFDYDANGNLTSKEVKEGQTTQESTTYGWDSENRLLQVVVDTSPIGQDNTGDRVVRFVYCPACRGNLSQKLVWEGSTSMDTTPTRWLRYEQDGLKELRVDERYDDDTPTNGIEEDDPWRTVSYTVHEPWIMHHELKTVSMLYSEDSEVLTDQYAFYYHFDKMGNVLAITGKDGAMQNTYTTDAFGVDQGDWGDDTYTARRITGKRYDSDVSFYYFGSRWYQPQTGQFVSVGPFGQDAEHPYALAEGTPTVLIDPDGLLASPDWCLFAATTLRATVAGTTAFDVYPLTRTLLLHALDLAASRASNGDPLVFPSRGWVSDKIRFDPDFCAAFNAKIKADEIGTVQGFSFVFKTDPDLSLAAHRANAVCVVAKDCRADCNVYDEYNFKYGRIKTWKGVAVTIAAYTQQCGRLRPFSWWVELRSLPIPLR